MRSPLVSALLLVACAHGSGSSESQCAPLDCASEANRRERAGDLPGAIELHRRACNGSMSVSCVRLAALSAADAPSALERACDLGDWDACGKSAHLYSLVARSEKLQARVAELYRRAC